MSAGRRATALAWWRVALAVAARPWLWSTAVAQIVRLAVPGWWRRAPFLPVPDREYLRFRMSTAYGDPGRLPVAEDVISYLHWCRAWPRLVG